MEPMREEDQETENSRSRNLLLRLKRRWKLLTFFGLVLLVMAVLNCYLLYKVHKPGAHSVEDTPSAERLVGDIGGLIGNDSSKQLSDSQKFFLNIGIRQDKKFQDCVESQFKHSFPNIDYAFLGYDIYRGYPLAESHDPGFTHPIFRADYSQKMQSADCRFSIPNGAVVIPDVSCVTSFSSTTIETERELAKALSVTVDISGGGYGASFSASTGYQQAKSSLSKENSVFVISTARCDYYFVKLRKELAPSFDPEFLIWLSKLDKANSNTTYIEFMDKFGTHFLTEATFGARFTYEHKMTSSYYKSTKNEKFSAAARASYSGSFSVGGGFSLDSEQREAATDFSKSVETRTITVGAAPPPNGDAMTWASTVQENPVPTKYTLEAIENLFVPEYVGSLGIDYETIRLNILKYKEDYEKFRENQEAVESLYEINTYMWSFNKKMLTVDNGGREGSWGPAEFCRRGTLAVGYNLKIERYHVGDNTGLNAVKLICANANGDTSNEVITSTEGQWGKYTKQDALCPQAHSGAYFLTRFSLQMHDWDKIAASFVTFECQDIQRVKKEVQLKIPLVHGEPLGTEWFTSESCPKGTAICGIKTKVQKYQGRKKDDSALNDVRFFCCGTDKIDK